MRNKKGHIITLVIVLGILAVFSMGYLLGSGSRIISNSGDDNNGKYDHGGTNFNLILPKSSSMFLEDEAGIACYTNVSQTLNLVTAKAQFRTIEDDTPNYVVGSLVLPSLPETEDVHCFVHKDGWIVTYYLKVEPVGKIIDWSYYSAGTLSKTKLTIGLEEMCLALGFTPSYKSYYDFEFPNANKLKIIIEERIDSGKDSFDIKLTSAFTYYERSWAHYVTAGYSYLYLNGIQISYIINGNFAYDLLTAAQLTLDVFHTIEVYNYLNGQTAYAAILLVYSDI